MQRKILLGLLIGMCLISLFFNLFEKQKAPRCINVDEVSFGYNSYSILKTGKDEYGTTLPLRFKSFGEFKLPLYVYASVPFIGLFGLNDVSVRMVNTVTAVFLPLVCYFLAYELTRKRSIAYTFGFIVASSLGLHIVGRLANEAYITLLLTLLTLLMFLRFIRTAENRYMILFAILGALSISGYNSAKVHMAFLLVAAGVYAYFKKVEWKQVLIVSAVFFIAFLPDIIYGTTRVGTLLFYKTPGFGMKVNEFQEERGSRIIFNKATVGIKTVVQKHLEYYSPQFFLSMGDENPKFGFPDMSILTVVEYLLFFIGLYYLFAKKYKHRYFITAFLFFIPFSGSLAWTGVSLTRALILIPIMLFMSAIGVVELLKSTPAKTRSFVLLALTVIYVSNLIFNWSFYLEHYPKRPLVILAEQCGYRTLVDIIKDQYPKKDKIYITKEHGQPYIFLLYYLLYPPEKYQPQAHLSGLDRYGFGQVDSFDKYVFSIPDNPPKNSLIVAHRNEFTDSPQRFEKLAEIATIKVDTETIFKIYETR